MIRRPPRSTLFPYTDALPISRVDGARNRRRSSDRQHVVDLARRRGVSSDSGRRWAGGARDRSEEHTSELQSRLHLVCRLLLEKKKKKRHSHPDDAAIL